MKYVLLQGPDEVALFTEDGTGQGVFPLDGPIRDVTDKFNPGDTIEYTNENLT